MFDDLDKDVASLKAKWFGDGYTPPAALDSQEEAIAAKWLGKTEARKLASTSNGKRYRPPVVLAHWGYIPEAREDRYSATLFSLVPLGGYFYCEVFSNGSRETIFEGDKMGCLRAVSRLQKMGISVTRVGSEKSPEEIYGHQKPKPTKSKRFDAEWLREMTQ